MCSQIIVLNRFEAEEFDYPYRWACISIANNDNDFAIIPEENRVGLLQLAFADITEQVEGFILFHDDLAHEIFDFVTRIWDEIDVLLIHCDAGISRSSAVAAAISRLRFGEEGEFIVSPFDPNPRVYQILREVASGRADWVDEHADFEQAEFDDDRADLDALESEERDDDWD